jgi:hypothetical protein
MNTGKEPFKCGMESAECGLRPNLISVIAKHRACATRPVRGLLRIAQPFMAGIRGPQFSKVPSGTKEPFCRPSRD